MVYIIGIPSLLLILLATNKRRGTLEFPEIEFKVSDAVILPAQVNAAAQRVDEYFRNRAAYGSLYGQYEAEFYWFEFGCTMRKMILTGALVLFGAGTTPQVVAALAVCILWFGLIANLKPFDSDIDDRLAQVEAIQILFTLLIGLVLQLQASTERGTKDEEDALGVVLIVINLAVIALAFVQQPIILKIASRISKVVVRIKAKAALCGKKEDSDGAADDTLVGIEMHTNPSHDVTNRDEHVTKIEMRSNPLAPASRVVTVGNADDAERTISDEEEKAEVTQLRDEIEQLRAEIKLLKQSRAVPPPIDIGGDEWWYSDVEEGDVWHGPFTPQQLEEWRDEGYFDDTMLVRHGRDGELVQLGKAILAEAPDALSETREGEDGFQYTKAEFVEHFGGTAEWDAAATTPLPLRRKEGMENSPPEATEGNASNWFYSDANDKVHGPFTLARLRRWEAKGHFYADFMVRQGLHGENKPLSELS